MPFLCFGKKESTPVPASATVAPIDEVAPATAAEPAAAPAAAPAPSRLKVAKAKARAFVAFMGIGKKSAPAPAAAPAAAPAEEPSQMV